ncbi:MAG: Gfo/Idh/MocA family protein [Candidatus Helarchaeota archaeon]
MNKIRFGIIGAGAVGYENTSLFKQNQNVELVSVASRTEEHASEFAKKFKMEKWYTDYKEMLEKEELDAVVICTPNNLHAEMAIAAAESGIHIFCEKPLTTSLEAADLIINAINKAKIKFMYAAHQRFFSGFNLLKEIIEKGVLGDISFVRARFTHKGPYTSWRASSKDKWFFDKNKAGGGVLLDLGIHHIDTLIWLFGAISEVTGASLGTFCKKMVWEDVASVTYKFENGTLGELEASWCALPSNIIEVHGYNGMLNVQALSYKASPNIECYPRKLKKNELIQKLTPETFLENVKLKMTDHFVESIIEDRDPIVSVIDGKKALEFVISAYKLANLTKD